MLEDGTRVLTQASFLRALGRHPKANVRREDGEERVPAILQGKALKPFISDEILEKSRGSLTRGGRPLFWGEYGSTSLATLQPSTSAQGDSGGILRGRFAPWLFAGRFVYEPLG